MNKKILRRIRRLSRRRLSRRILLGQPKEELTWDMIRDPKFRDIKNYSISEVLKLVEPLLRHEIKRLPYRLIAETTEEQYHEAVTALAKAHQAWDPKRGEVSFYSFLLQYLKGHVWNEVRKGVRKGELIVYSPWGYNIPEETLTDAQLEGTAPIMSPVTKKQFHITDPGVKLKKMPSAISLEEPVEEEWKRKWEEVIPSGEPTPLEELERKEEREEEIVERLRNALEKASPGEEQKKIFEYLIEGRTALESALLRRTDLPEEEVEKMSGAEQLKYAIEVLGKPNLARTETRLRKELIDKLKRADPGLPKNLEEYLKFRKRRLVPA